MRCERRAAEGERVSALVEVAIARRSVVMKKSVRARDFERNIVADGETVVVRKKKGRLERFQPFIKTCADCQPTDDLPTSIDIAQLTLVRLVSSLSGCEVEEGVSGLWASLSTVVRRGCPSVATHFF